jgi:hypothetical protein
MSARPPINIVVRNGVRTSTDFHMLMAFAVLPTILSGGTIAERLNEDGSVNLPDYVGSCSSEEVNRTSEELFDWIIGG